MSEMQFVSTTITFVPFVDLDNCLLLMGSTWKIQVKIGEDFKILKGRFI